MSRGRVIVILFFMTLLALSILVNTLRYFRAQKELDRKYRRYDKGE